MLFPGYCCGLFLRVLSSVSVCPIALASCVATVMWLWLCRYLLISLVGGERVKLPCLVYVGWYVLSFSRVGRRFFEWGCAGMWPCSFYRVYNCVVLVRLCEGD
jgi:hypothetical protein